MLLVAACDTDAASASPTRCLMPPPSRSRLHRLRRPSRSRRTPFRSLAIWGLAAIANGAEIALNFTDASSLLTKETVFAGVPVGTADLLPGDTFIPDLVVANYGTSATSVSVSYNSTARRLAGKRDCRDHLIAG